MALALGLGNAIHAVSRNVSLSIYAPSLGSLFNHSQKPNVLYTIDPTTDSIRYTTSRRVLPDEELSIFYGHKLWFEPADAADGISAEAMEEHDDEWGGLGGVGTDEDDFDVAGRSMFEGFSEGDPDQVIPEEELPFKRLKLTPDEEEEEDMDSVRKGTSIYDRPEVLSDTLGRGRLGGRSSRSSVSSYNVEVCPSFYPFLESPVDRVHPGGSNRVGSIPLRWRTSSAYARPTTG